jgi:hypothetical protein
MKTINFGYLLRLLGAFTFIIFLSSAIIISSLKDRTYKNLSLRTRILAAKLSFYQSVKDSLEGTIAPSRTSQYNVFQQLVNTATTEELYALTNHKNEVVKCYAFRGLLQRNAPIFDLVVQNIHNRSIVLEQSWGCLNGGVSAGSVSDFFIFNSIDHLNKQEKLQLDSIFLFTEFELEKDFFYKYALLSEIEPKENYYSQIRKLCTEKKYFFLLPLLAQYQNPQDKPLIIKALQQNINYGLFNDDSRSEGLLAVENFPDTAFYPILKSLQTQSLTMPSDSDNISPYILYKAIFAYEPAVAKLLLRYAIEFESSYHNIEASEHTKTINSLITEANVAQYHEILDLISPSTD